MEKSVSAAEANRKFPELLRGVREGRSYTVTSHGRPVARIVPASANEGGAERARASLLSCLERQRAIETAAGAEGVDGVSRLTAALGLLRALPRERVVLPVQVPGELFNILVRKAARSRSDA